MTLNIGIIGDLHAHWDDIDVAQLNNSDYDLLFFVGDLGGGTRDSTLRIARSIARMQKPTLVLPGNNDTWDLAELRAELSHRAGIRKLTHIHNGSPDADEPDRVQLCGFSTHPLTSTEVNATLIVGRPHSLGGADLSFPDYMMTHYDIDSIEASRDRMCSLVDSVDTEDVLFIAHNGPLGLGDQPDDMWGCDFKPDGGDWGDPDLAHAVSHARRRGHRVHAVIGGHMHLRTKAGAERAWKRTVDNVAYVNVARVPRIFGENNVARRHHVAVTLNRSGVEIEERFFE